MNVYPLAPPVALFVEGTSRGGEAWQKIVSGLQRAGRSVQVFAGSGVFGPPRARLPSVVHGCPLQGALPPPRA